MDRKPMTPEEYEKASKQESYHKYTYTKVPPTINKIHWQMSRAMAEVIRWLEWELGVETDWGFWFRKGEFQELRERMGDITAFEIKVRHDNDYVECGPGYKDPNRQRFHIITPFNLTIKFPPEDTLYVTQQLALFSDHKLKMNKKLPSVHLSFFSWERKLGASSMDNSAQYGIKLTYNLKFEMRHTWGSEFNEGD